MNMLPCSTRSASSTLGIKPSFFAFTFACSCVIFLLLNIYQPNLSHNMMTYWYVLSCVYRVPSFRFTDGSSLPGSVQEASEWV